MSRLQNLAAGAAKKSNCGLFETTLRAVLFNPLITDLFLGAKILESCFLQWHFSLTISGD